MDSREVITALVGEIESLRAQVGNPARTPDYERVWAEVTMLGTAVGEDTPAKDAAPVDDGDPALEP